MINSNSITKDISEKNDLGSVVITGFNELTEEEYKEWVRD